MVMLARTGRHGPRSKNGCTTCRTRKVKCDEQRPLCSKCAHARIRCDWDQPVRKRGPPTGKAATLKAGLISTRKLPLEPASKDSESNSTKSLQDGEFSPEESRPDDEPFFQSLVRRKHANTSPLCSALSPDHIEMSNSLILDPQDLRSFQYVPESLMVLRFGKPWRWSMLSYVHSRIAPRESGVMSAFIAVASLELRFRDLVRYQDGIVTQTSLEKASKLRYSATNYLHLALKDLSSILDRASQPDPDPNDLEALFSLWFLILHCGLYDPELIRVSQVHLNGIRSFVSQYLQKQGGSNARGLPPASQQLLLFITYIDVNLALGNMNGGQLSLDLLSIPADSPLAFDRVWEAARVCLPKLWGEEYPPEEILDDVENYRGLSFLHAGQKLKLSIWRLGVAKAQGKFIEDSKARLWNKICEIGEDFTDLLTLGKIASSSGGRRVMWTVYHGCLDFLAVKVLYSCIDGSDEFPEWLSATLGDLLAIAYKSQGENPLQLYRCAWPLAVALLKVRDPIHRDWIHGQLRKARVLFSNLGLPTRLLDKPESPETLFLDYNQNSLVEEIG